MSPAAQPRPSMPVAIGIFVAIVALDLATRTFVPSQGIVSHVSLGFRVLIVVGLVRRSEAARIAAIVLGVFCVLFNFLHMFFLLVFAADQGLDGAALIRAVLNFGFGGYILIAFNHPKARDWTRPKPTLSDVEQPGSLVVTCVADGGGNPH